jgi:hypothetical protein
LIDTIVVDVNLAEAIAIDKELGTQIELPAKPSSATKFFASE